LSGPVAVVFALVALRFPDLKPYVAAWGVALSVADVVWLSRWQKSLRETAAKIQEAFDCDVLELDWHQLKVGKAVDHEKVVFAADKYSRVAMRFGPLDNWYPADVAVLPLASARAICQRINCWWDVEQRARYATLVKIFTGVLLAVLVVLGFWQKMTVSELALSLAAPFSPLVLLGVRQIFENVDAIGRLEKLKEHSESMWKRLLGGAQVGALDQDARALQDEIFDARKRNPPVLDRLYEKLRRDHETAMVASAAEYVKQLQAVSPKVLAPRAPP
jgi:hypothetical protein